MVCVPASTIFYHVKESCFLTSYSLWIFCCLSQLEPVICEYRLICNKWPNVIFFNGYVTLSFFVFTGFFFYLWISFISSQYKYICEIIYIFHNGKILYFSIYLFISYYIDWKHLWKLFLFSLLSKNTPISKSFKNFFMRNFSLFMRFFALLKKII